MDQLWSWSLSTLGVVGLYVAGRRRWWGWGIGLAAQPFWIAYAIHTRQWGFLASAAAYGGVYAWNLAKWRRARQTVEAAIASGDLHLDDDDAPPADAARTEIEVQRGGHAVAVRADVDLPTAKRAALSLYRATRPTGRREDPDPPHPVGFHGNGVGQYEAHPAAVLGQMPAGPLYDGDNRAAGR